MPCSIQAMPPGANSMRMPVFCARFAPTRRSARPPFEALYLIPVAALFVVISFSENAVLGHAIQIILGGGLAVAWLSGAILSLAPVTPRRAAAHVAAALSAMTAIALVAILREGLADLLLQTIRYGLDR